MQYDYRAINFFDKSVRFKSKIVLLHRFYHSITKPRQISKDLQRDKLEFALIRVQTTYFTQGMLTDLVTHVVKRAL